MGNCVDRWSTFCNETERIGDQKQGDGDQIESGQLKFGLEAQQEEKKDGFRVKMVLTKEELVWLLLQLQGVDKEGRRLKDVLKEMEKGRIPNKPDENLRWKPSLESIMEAPEVQAIEA